MTPTVTEKAGIDKANNAPKTQREMPPSNLVLGLTLPQWRHTPWAEPLIMVQHYDPAAPFGEDGGDIEAWKRQAREMWDDNWGPEPSEALRVARMALDAAMSSDDIREAAEAAPYIVHTCSSTVPAHEDGDEEVLPEELDDDLREVVSLFEGATVVRLAHRPRAEDDDIPFEAPDIEAGWAKMRADLAASEARWAEWRASAAQVPGRSSELDCRLAA